MIKHVLLTGLLTIALGMPTMKAQDSYLSETNANDVVLIRANQNAASSTFNKTANKFAVALQVPYNGYKLGAGLRFSYDFTDILRFTMDGNYYFYNAPSRRFRTINQSGEKGKAAWGRQFDMNFNLNFVFGNGDFHFFVIAGVYVPFGYSKLDAVLDGTIGEEHTGDMGITIDNKYYYYKDKLRYVVGIGANVGCGVEYQITDKYRVFLDQQISIGVMSCWMAKIGGAYCF